jgi:tellurite resistance protein
MPNSAALYPLFSDLRLSADEASAIAAALRDVAAVDGTHADEQELIGELMNEIAGEVGDAHGIGAITPAELAARLVGADLRTLALQSAVLLAMADGAISPAERARILEYALAFGVNSDEYASIEKKIEGWVRSGDPSPMF